MSIVFAGNITRFLRGSAEDGDTSALAVIAFANEYIALAERPSPDPASIEDLLARVTSVERHDWPYLVDVIRMVSGLHRDHVVLPNLPTVKILATDPRAEVAKSTIACIVRGEGRYVRQRSSLDHYGHVVLTVDPLPLEQLVRLEWLLPETVVPKHYMLGSFAGIEEVVVEPLADGSLMTGLHVSIVGGSCHLVDSSEHAFRFAGASAIRDALAKASLVPFTRPN